MEINVANVAWRKIFLVGSQAPLAKKENIGELSTEEIQEITDNAIPVTTKNNNNSYNFQVYVVV